MLRLRMPHLLMVVLSVYSWLTGSWALFWPRDFDRILLNVAQSASIPTAMLFTPGAWLFGLMMIWMVRHRQKSMALLSMALAFNILQALVLHVLSHHWFSVSVFLVADLPALVVFLLIIIQQTSQQSVQESGKVKWFNARKGYGFIHRPNGEDIYVGIRNLRVKSLAPGQSVSYLVVKGEKGLFADEVRTE